MVELQQPNIHNILNRRENEEDGILKANMINERNNMINESDSDSESEMSNWHPNYKVNIK